MRRKHKSEKKLLQCISFQLFSLILFIILEAKSVWATHSITAQLNKKTFLLNQSAVLTITLTNTGDGEITLPAIDGIHLRQYGQTKQSSSIDGKTTTSVTYKYLLQGEKEGKYKFPPIIFTQKGETLKSMPLTFTILPTTLSQSTSMPPSPPQAFHKQGTQKNTQLLFELARLEVHTQKQLYVGERVPVEIKAFFNTNIQEKSIIVPTLDSDGITMPPITHEPQRSQEELKGKMWNVVTWQTTLTGVKEGTHPLHINMSATALLTQFSQKNQRGLQGPLDRFFGGAPFTDSFLNRFFSNYDKIPLRLTWKEKFTVQPLPEKNRPTDFSGAVGEFNFTVSTRTDEIKAGEPFLLTIRVIGAGNFDKIDIPQLPESASFQTYPPKIHFTPLGNMGGGQKMFEQALVIKDPSTKEIPTLSFVYFDPASKQYISKKSTPIPIKIRGQHLSTTPAVSTAPPKKKENESILQPRASFPLKIKTGKITKEFTPLPQRLWFQLTVIFLFFTLLLLLLIAFRHNIKTYNSLCTLRKQAKKRLRADLMTACAAKEHEDQKLFLNACRVAIQNQLAHHCGVHPSAMSLDDLYRILPDSSPLIEIFQLADTSSCGGKEISHEEMAKLYLQLKAALEKLI